MKTPERFNRAIKALVHAFFNDTLVSLDCRACAVGNIVAFGRGTKVVKDPSGWGHGTESGYDNGAWFYCINGGLIRRDPKENKMALDNILATGYTAEQINEIEQTFVEIVDIDESNPFGIHALSSKSKSMGSNFKGLLAVVDLLCKYDNIEPTEYKKAFEYTADFKPVTILSEVD